MTNEHGKSIKTDYLRTLLKRTNISVVYSRTAGHQSPSPVTSPRRDKPIRAVIKLRRPVSLDSGPPEPRPTKTVTFREPMTVSGSGTLPADRPAGKPRSPERTVPAARQRPSSEDIPWSKSRRSPTRPRTYERAEAELPRHGTIRRSYEPDRRFRPLAVFRAFERPAGDNHAVENDSVRENGISPGSELEEEEEDDEEELRLMAEEDAISTFPFVDDNELDKHKRLNAEAEQFDTRSPGPYDSYLKRLKLERKAVDQKLKEQAKGKKKGLIKRVQTKPRFLRDFKEEAPVDKPDPPPQKTKEEKATRMLLDFKYSYAVEQFYGSQMRHSTNFSPMSDSYVNYSQADATEVKNGCVVKTLGANVLNLKARTMPSCNPFELRLRRQLAREKAMLQKKQSIVSQASVRSQLSQESLLKLRRLSVCRKESTVSNAFTDVSGLYGDHPRVAFERKSVDSQSGLPEIRIDRVENLVSRSLDSSPEGPEYVRRLSHPHKTISLNLPSVVMEDV